MNNRSGHAGRYQAVALTLLIITLAVIGLNATTRGQTAGKAAEDDPTRRKIDELIAQLRSTDVSDKKRWGAIRDLAEMGKPALPRLVEELDRTTEDRALRSLGFTLRAMGDPRAVPVLIRAIPRTFMDAGSDFGMTVEDPALIAYLKRHDLDPGDKGEHFRFGRPFREITGALRTLTGHRFNEDELNFLKPQGGKEQRRLQMRFYHQLAKRWAGWWDANSKRFTDDLAYAKTDFRLPPLPEVATVKDAKQPFPTGAKLKSDFGYANAIVGPPQPLKYYRTFNDLDTGRDLAWPDSLPDPEKAQAADVADWAAREGYDLRGIEYKPLGSDLARFAIQGLDLRAWRIDNSRFDTIGQELLDGKAPDLSRPVKDGLLIDVDGITGDRNPDNQATFLFVTREGATGVLQVTGIVDDLFDESDIGKPAGGGGKPKGFYRGVQFSYKLLYEE